MNWWFNSLVVIGLILLLIFLAVVIWGRPTRQLELPVSLASWKSQPSSDPTKNTCQIYQFQPTIGPDNSLIPPTPTLQVEVLNGMTGQTGTLNCSSNLAIVAQQMERTCQVNPNISNQLATPYCLTFDGQVVSPGYVETYYQSCVNTPCPGEIALLVVSSGGTDFSCLGIDDNQQVKIVDCSPTDSSQWFQVIRKTATTTQDLNNGGGLNGSYAQLQHYNSLINQQPSCLAIDFSTTVQTGCPNQTIYSGYKIVLGSCQSPGNWLMVPSLTTCYPNTTPTDRCCSGGPDCINGQITGTDYIPGPCCRQTPQQLLSSTNVDSKILESLNLNNYTQTSQLVDELTSGNYFSFSFLQESGLPFLGTYQEKVSASCGPQVTVSYVTLNDYNSYSNALLCQNGSPNCLPF